MRPFGASLTGRNSHPWGKLWGCSCATSAPGAVEFVKRSCPVFSWLESKFVFHWCFAPCSHPEHPPQGFPVLTGAEWPRRKAEPGTFPWSKPCAGRACAPTPAAGRVNPAAGPRPLTTGIIQGQGTRPWNSLELKKSKCMYGGMCPEQLEKPNSEGTFHVWV